MTGPVDACPWTVSAICWESAGQVPILGIRNCGRPENCGANFVLGVIVLVLVVIGLVVNVAVSGPTGAAYSVVGLVLSILYLQGAKQNRDAWKAAQS